MIIDIDFKELENAVVNEFKSQNKMAGKTLFPEDIVAISARVAIVAIQKYHEAFHQSQQENQ
ncbi:hypothetical protein FLT15_31575 [Paenibacillus thiaminolyticus]|uniref:hypothetical protein n=1 Tax=Paenibacillus thiaminolyticus TaxID=49283 RepID=UPI001163A8FB|nr:hypothetical protein [Paenibacillus thiaminolyticus]NGP58821.1 hypothetical protein [Paenibacillus thiaminolyticus]NGP62709.1 hypothetical protein [Paenibacillus thiaminolyticus]